LGVLAFLKTQQNHRKLERIVLMDYVMPQWKCLVVDSLLPLISPLYVPQVDTASCNVRFAWTEACNQAARETVLDWSPAVKQDGACCLILISYLLTETHGNWTQFLKELLQKLPPKSLLLLSEPTAWQLHNFLKVFEELIDCHRWLDSSRDTPELQDLEERKHGVGFEHLSN
jgi:hypothetical protein